MPLFRDHPIRSTVCVAAAFAVAHGLTRMLHSLYAFHLTQTSVAIVGISGLMLLIAMNHRNEQGHRMTQMQEEMVLIVGFAFLWLVVNLGWRAISSQEIGQGDAVGQNLGERSYCSDDDIYCIVEEYSYF